MNITYIGKHKNSRAILHSIKIGWNEIFCHPWHFGVKHFDQNTSAFHILLYYSNPPIFAPETFNLTPQLRPLIRNLWPYPEPPTLNLNLWTWPLYFTFPTYLWTSPTLEINRHRIPTSKGATLKLKPRPFIQPTSKAPKLQTYFRYPFWHILPMEK